MIPLIFFLIGNRRCAYHERNFDRNRKVCGGLDHQVRQSFVVLLQTNKQANKQTNEQTNKPTNKQTSKQTNKQTRKVKSRLGISI